MYWVCGMDVLCIPPALANAAAQVVGLAGQRMHDHDSSLQPCAPYLCGVCGVAVAASGAAPCCWSLKAQERQSDLGMCVPAGR